MCGCALTGRKMGQAAGPIHDGGEPFLQVFVMQEVIDEQLLKSVQRM